MYLKYSLILTLLLTLIACSDKNVKEIPFLEYYYPFDSEPKVYVYQDSLNPLYEVFERVFTVEDPMGKHLWIERYNTNFSLTETVEILATDKLNVRNHLIGVRGNLESAVVRDSLFFPSFGTSIFSSTFPSNNDTIVFHYEIKRTLQDKKGIFNWEDKTLETINTLDSVKAYIIDVKNEKEKVNLSLAKSVYAKGLGKVQVFSLNGAVNLQLKRVLTDEEWKFIVTKE
jgi:hypothetical protein